MTDQAWVRWMGKLALAFPMAETTPDQAAARADVYRTELDDLDDETWGQTAREALRTCGFFPTIADLLRLSEKYAPARRELPEHASPEFVARYEEQVKRRREEAAKGRSLFFGGGRDSGDLRRPLN